MYFELKLMRLMTASNVLDLSKKHRQFCFITRKPECDDQYVFGFNLCFR